MAFSARVSSSHYRCKIAQNIICCITDYSKGFGGKFGVQKDRQDKSAAGWDHIEKVDKHESQKGKSLVGIN